MRTDIVWKPSNRPDLHPITYLPGLWWYDTTVAQPDIFPAECPNFNSESQWHE
jgi:hypothetical protein